jgi:hypothetical protein
MREKAEERAHRKLRTSKPGLLRGEQDEKGIEDEDEQPKVTMVMGKVRTTRMGRTIALMSRDQAAMSAATTPLMATRAEDIRNRMAAVVTTS